MKVTIYYKGIKKRKESFFALSIIENQDNFGFGLGSRSHHIDKKYVKKVKVVCDGK